MNPNQEIRNSVKAPAPERTAARQHLQLTDRKLLEVNCVCDVVRFDEESVVLTTDFGILQIEGSDLHVQILNLEQGTVTLDGKVTSLLFFDGEMQKTEGKKSFFGKLFH